jgi:ABC-2 type transport system permease protein
VLVVISPQGLGDKERYAIDQFLMRGGAVVLGASNHMVALDQFTGNLVLQPVEGGLSDMLASYGMRVEDALVLDPQNEPFPIQVDRKVGDLTVREVEAMNYPFFVDVRPDGMDKGSPIVANLPAMTVNWASPVTVDEAKNRDRKVDILLKSSSESWLQNGLSIQPDMEAFPGVGFPVAGDLASRPLAVAVRGSFESYFKGKPSPIQASTDVTNTAETPVTAVTGAIEQSPDTARLVVVGSSDFLTDVIFQISSSLSQDRYLNSLRFLQNAVDWSAEDLDLLGIRARGAGTRVLAPLPKGRQALWEGLNYALVILALAGIGLGWYLRLRHEKPMASD